MVREDRIRDTGTIPGRSADFDVDQFLTASAEAELQRVHDQLDAKNQQIERRVTLYEDTVTSLKTDLREVDHELKRLTRTSEHRPRLEARRDSLRGDLTEARRRFQKDLRVLEDEKLALEEELEEIVEARVLVEGLGSDDEDQPS